VTPKPFIVASQMLLRLASSEAGFSFLSDEIDDSSFLFSVALSLDRTMESLSWELKSFSLANELGRQGVDLMGLLLRFCSKNSDWVDGEGVILDNKYG
jgi:hypothetical protein